MPQIKFSLQTFYFPFISRNEVVLKGNSQTLKILADYALELGRVNPRLRYIIDFKHCIEVQVSTI